MERVKAIPHDMAIIVKCLYYVSLIFELVPVIGGEKGVSGEWFGQEAMVSAKRCKTQFGVITPK